MATVETLEKLERRVSIFLPREDIDKEVDKRLKVQARTAKAHGFRKGKVPLKMVAAQYGEQIHSDVVHEMLNTQFNVALTTNELQIAGRPSITEKTEEVPEDQIGFDLTFEVYPEFEIGDLTALEVEKSTTEVGEEDIERTLTVLRKGQAQYHAKGEQTAEAGDRATVDFSGTIDGVEFEGGQATDFTYILGEGQMLPEFEEAVAGMKVGEEKKFTLNFPENYQSDDVAGKEAEFTVTLKKLEAGELPEVNEEFATLMGIADGSVETLRDEIRQNLEGEAKNRIDAENKNKVMDALLEAVEFDAPTALVRQESGHLMEMMRQNVAQQGMDPANVNLPLEVFAPQAERRVKLGLLLGDLVEAQSLVATADQVREEVERIAKTYQQPQMVIDYYYSDKNRIQDVENGITETNVVEYVLGQAKVTEVAVPFQELMEQKQA